MHILFLFVDGIGLGDPSGDNPFSTIRLPGFERLAGGQPWLRETPVTVSERALFREIDPRLDVDGLPQSGTGQATLLTGINCGKIAGRHYGPYPHSKTKPVIAEHNLFKQVERLLPEADEPSAFANAYPDRFFEYVKRTDRWTVTTRCCLESGARVRSSGDLAAGLAVPADLTGVNWPERFDPAHMPKSEEDAARRLLHIASNHSLTLFEYYLTDKAGHRQASEEAEAVLRSFDRLLGELLREMDPAEVLLVLTSDHGNLEDLSIKTHTRNDVPLAAFGAGAGRLEDVACLEEVTPALVELLRTV